MRRAEGKTHGYIVVPIVMPEGVEFEEFAETTAFKTVVRIITALSMSDERIVDELRALHYGRVPSGKIINIEGNVPVGMHISLDRFAEAISVKIWARVARVNWLPFEEARAFVRGLKLKRQPAWLAYCKSGKKPNDIPSNPQQIYANAGWMGSSDWLGHGQPRGRWRAFEEARAFVRALNLENEMAWRAYCNSGNKPQDIPTNAPRFYADAGWVSFSDWLGSKFRRVGWRSFEDARAFVRALKLQDGDAWRAYCNSGNKP